MTCQDAEIAFLFHLPAASGPDVLLSLFLWCSGYLARNRFTLPRQFTKSRTPPPAPSVILAARSATSWKPKRVPGQPKWSTRGAPVRGKSRALGKADRISCPAQTGGPRRALCPYPEDTCWCAAARASAEAFASFPGKPGACVVHANVPAHAGWQQRRDP